MYRKRVPTFLLRLECFRSTVRHCYADPKVIRQNRHHSVSATPKLPENSLQELRAHVAYAVGGRPTPAGSLKVYGIELYFAKAVNCGLNFILIAWNMPDKIYIVQSSVSTGPRPSHPRHPIPAHASPGSVRLSLPGARCLAATR
jgi:hypothetical protein